MNYMKKLEEAILQKIQDLPGQGSFLIAKAVPAQDTPPRFTKLDSQELAEAIAHEKVMGFQAVHREGMTTSWTPIDKTQLVLVLNEAEAFRENNREAFKALERVSIQASDSDTQALPTLKEAATHIATSAVEKAAKVALMSTPHGQAIAMGLEVANAVREGEPLNLLKTVDDANSLAKSKELLPEAFRKMGLETKGDLAAAIETGFEDYPDDAAQSIQSMLEEFEIDVEPSTKLLERNEVIQLNKLRAHPGFMSEDVEVHRAP